MPLITSTPYLNSIRTHNFIVDDPTSLNLLIDVIVNKKIENLNNFLDSGSSVYTEISWEFAIVANAQNINFGAPMHAIFNGNTTLLHALVYSDNIDILTSLINHQVDFNQYGYFTGAYNGYKPIDGTPLHMLMQYEDTKLNLVELMLDNGALLNILNSSGETALQSAQRVKNIAMTNFLEDYIQSHDLGNQKSITFQEYQAELALKKAELDALDTNSTVLENKLEANHTDLLNSTVIKPKVVAQNWSEWASSSVLNPYNWFSTKSSSDIKLADVLKTNGEIDFGSVATSKTVASHESAISDVFQNSTILQAFVPLPQNETALNSEWV